MLRVLLGLAIAVSIVHYVDNTVRYDDYVQGASTPVARWMVPASWFLFTAAGVAGLLLYERGRYGPAAGLLAFYSVSGLIGFAHYQSISPTDFDAAPEHVHRARHRVRCVDPGLRRLDRPCDAERPGPPRHPSAVRPRGSAAGRRRAGATRSG